MLEKIQNHICEHFQLEEDKVAAMLPAFLATLQNHVQNLEEVLEASGEPLEIGKVGHALKGALLNLGLEDLAKVAQTIELEGKAGNREADYAGLIERLKGEMAEILSASGL